MHRFSLTLSVLLLASFTITPPQPSAAEPAPVKPADPKAADDWKADPACRMVFFAVLQGLYEDGVSRAAVDSVVGKTSDSPAEVRHTFVFQCPLCHPVYEAFRVYQQRPTFRDQGDTFGKGLDPALERGLRDKSLRARQGALQTVVQRWVERRLTALRLTAAEKSDWARRLEERSSQGNALLLKLRATDSWYMGWGYGFCAACKGCTGVCRTLKEPGK